MDAADILPKFKGIAVHDHWFPYFTYKQAIRALCNTRHLRELIFIHEQEKEDWATQMQKKRNCVLQFMHNFAVFFTNNQGEQDIRMVKLKQKISCCFRTLRSGQIFCRIRSYISTAPKQGWSSWDALAEEIRGSPRLLTVDQKPTLETVGI